METNKDVVANLKKKWTAPQIEIINTVNIEGGSHHGGPESMTFPKATPGQSTFGYS